jgi:hypothetical protein
VEVSEHTCEKAMGMWGRKPCGKPAKFREAAWTDELQWFCGMHAPSQRKARAEKLSEKRRIADAPRLEKEAADRRIRNAAADMLGALKYIRVNSGDPVIENVAEAAIAKAEGR